MGHWSCHYPHPGSVEFLCLMREFLVVLGFFLFESLKDMPGVVSLCSFYQVVVL